MKKALAICACGLFGILLSCSKENIESSDPPFAAEVYKSPTDTIKEKAPSQLPWRNYIIRQGGHTNIFEGLNLFQKDSMAFYFSFDSTAIYQTVDPKNQADWNKLMGFSDCQSHHHQNSARLVWRWTEGVGVEIGEYYYISRNREYKGITKVNIGDTVFASVSAGNGYYTLQVGDVISEKIKKCNNRLASYLLYPYFGGDEVAPHNINVHIRHLYP